MRVEYRSNNSGGSWWLKAGDWRAPEKAGWFIEWGGTWFCRSKYDSDGRRRAPICPEDADCPGHRKFESAELMTTKDRWLGTLASSAYKDFPSVAEAVAEWERITHQDASDEGCNCCGKPHSFSARDEAGTYHYAEIERGRNSLRFS